MTKESRLKLTEIFRSLQGEADTVGIPTVFVRLTGCPLRCHYCDTAYAFHGGQWWTLPEILARVAELEQSLQRAEASRAEAAEAERARAAAAEEAAAPAAEEEAEARERKAREEFEKLFRDLG